MFVFPFAFVVVVVSSKDNVFDSHSGEISLVGRVVSVPVSVPVPAAPFKWNRQMMKRYETRCILSGLRCLYLYL